MVGTLEDFLARTKSKRWPIYMNTGNRNELAVGDVIVFYLGGHDHKKILGTARVASKLLPGIGTDFFIKISDVDLWNESVPMKDLLDSLEFILNKNNWGAYL